VLVVTEEDCDPTSLDLPRRPSMVVGCDLDSGWSPLGRAAEPAAFARGAIDDAVARAGREWGVETMRFDRFESMLAWLSRSDRELIVTAWAPVGPVADELARIEPELTMDGTGLIRIRRHWDEIAWPEASRGFFRMKRIIPDLVGQAV
jgi:deoxyribodipyrimidine photo-lyase